MSGVLFAQPHGDHEKKSPEEKATHRTEMMRKKLKLTEEQIPQVKALNLEFIQQVDSIQKNTSPGPERGVQMEQLLTSSNEKMKAVLTAEQYPMYLEMVEKQKERMKHKHRERHHEHEE